MALASGTAYNMMNAHAMTGPSLGYTSSTTSSSGSGGSGSTVVNNTTNNYYGGGSSSSGGGSDAADEAASEIAEDFEDWFSNLFDWIEVTLQHLTDQISLYIKKAENALDQGFYNTSASYYQSAISDTVKQIGNESTAISKYQAQANEVLSRSGLDSGTIADITKKYDEGSLSIEEYSEEVRGVISDYQEFADKAREAESALEDLNADIISYVKNLKDVRDAQRDVTVNLGENRQSFGNARYVSTNDMISQGGWSRFLLSNRELQKQNTAYETETANVESDTTSLGDSAKKKINSELKKTTDTKYKKALETAKTAVKSKKAVKESTLKTISAHNSQLASSLIAYNQGVENLELARSEEAINYAESSAEIYSNLQEYYDVQMNKYRAQNELYSSRASASTSAATSASYQNKVTKNDAREVANDRELYQELKGDVATNSSTITSGKYKTSQYKKASDSRQARVDKHVEKARSQVKQGLMIGSRTLSGLYDDYCDGYITREFYEACVDYDNALSYSREASTQLLTDLEELMEQKISARQEKRDNYINEYERKLTAATSARTFTASSKNSQLEYSNTMLEKENTQYQKAVEDARSDLDVNTSGSIANTIAEDLSYAKSNASGKDYINALKEAEKYMKNQQKIPSSTLSTISSNNANLYRELLMYNDAVDELEYEKQEYALQLTSSIAEAYSNILEETANLNDEANNKIDLLQLQSSNANGAKNKNSFLDQVAQQYDQIVKNDENTLKTLTSDVSSYSATIAKETGKGENYSKIDTATQTKVSDFIQTIKKRVSQGKEITSSQQATLYDYYTKGYISEAFYVSCINYINALASKEEMEAQLAIDEQTAIQQKIQIGQQEFENVEQDYENLRTANNDITDMLKAKQNTATTRGIIMTEQDYRDLIAQNDIDRQIYTDEVAALQQQVQYNLDQGYWTTDTQEYLDALHAINQYEVEIENCNTLQEEYNNSIAALPYEAIDRLLDSLEKLEAWYKAHNSLLTTANMDLQISDYSDQLYNLEDQIEQYEAKRSQAIEDLQKAMADPDQVYGGKTVQEWEDEIVEFDTEVQNLEADFVSLLQDMRDDVFWRDFERAHDAAERFEDVLSGIVDLINDDMMFNYDGDITSYGIAQLGNYMKELQNAETEIENYMNDLDNLNKLYDEGWYTDLDYAEKLAELQEDLLDAASSVQGFTQDIIDIFQTYAQNQLDQLFDLIDARKEALQAKKEYYDYDKTIRDKNKDIESLQAQIAALEGVDKTALSSLIAGTPQSYMRYNVRMKYA